MARKHKGLEAGQGCPIKKKRQSPTQREKTWKACSCYIRLRDAIAYCKERGIDLGQFAKPEDVIGKCATCGAVKPWIRMDAGHCIGRGIGGGSGVYFNEKNLALQCKQCNAWKQGARPEFEEHLKQQHGPEIMEELTRLNFTHKYSSMELSALEIYFKQEYEKLLNELKGE